MSCAPGIVSNDWDLNTRKSEAHLYVLETQSSCYCAKVKVRKK